MSDKMKSMVDVAVEAVEKDLEYYHNQYVQGLRNAIRALQAELADHEMTPDPEKGVRMPSTSMRGDLMCDRIRDAQDASDRMRTLSEQLSVLKHLQREGR